MSERLRKDDRLRSSWSEDVRLGNGGKVYVSTAIETTASTTSMEHELERLTGLMAQAHITNIEAARSGDAG
jgi:hypothetical protein